MGVNRMTVSKWRADPAFQEEFDKQLKLYRANFDDVTLADRKERVKALDGIFQELEGKQVSLKIKVLQAIRQEVGDDKQILEINHTGTIGIEAPPRAESYEEWVKQNVVMDRAKASEVRPVPGEFSEVSSTAASMPALQRAS
tara:strand:- start:88 stop:513 length:426 start_codon:yes stop_codon:yes gene_type:complete